MTIEKEVFCTDLTGRYRAARGWSEEMATDAANVAYLALCNVYGGEKHYIPKPKTDSALIKSEFAAGISIPTLARRHCLTARRIRQIVTD